MLPPAASKDSLYARLGGYDAIAAVVDDLLPRMRVCAASGRAHAASIQTTANGNRQLISSPPRRAGRRSTSGANMKTSHRDMGIDQADYAAFKRYLAAVLEKFQVPERERAEVIAFVSSLESEIVAQ